MVFFVLKKMKPYYIYCGHVPKYNPYYHLSNNDLHFTMDGGSFILRYMLQLPNEHNTAVQKRHYIYKDYYPT